ncbi:DNA-binding protein HEXBP isoform X1 [Spatholobus suberectus]|nr:DNA-binding protein HEXBP isoform X1 [Spatholobus suberectus]
MDMRDRLSSTEPHDLADEATAEIEIVSKKKELPLRLYFGNGPRVHEQLCIEYAVVNRRCEQCGKVGQLTCFSSSFRKWALRRVTEKELNQTCSICSERGHNYLDCDLRIITHRLDEVTAPKERRLVHCGFCGEVGHNQRTCLKARHN